LVVLMNMHTMVMERTREIGILKALGFTRFEIMQMLMGETTVLAVAGSLVGIGITFLTQAILKQTLPSLPIQISAAWVLASFALAMLGSALGATIPAMRAAGFDPVEALAYE
ncbi:MAG: FtsX-like permease family protein, partial [Candidatus Acidiferrum sp.]